jgi:hypothetical protein
MGDIREHSRVLLIVAAFSRHGESLDWARDRVISEWGKLALESDRFAFDFTSFYEREMGTALEKCFFACEQLLDPGELPAIKRVTNQWEEEHAHSADHLEARPLNLDPGYISEAKLVLASTKDRDHRIYLSQGIFAEGTLYFYKGQWATRPWTYPDYQSAEYKEFFTRCREYLRLRIRETRR